MSDITRESVSAKTDHYVNVFVRKNDARIITTLESLTLTPFCLEKNSVRGFSGFGFQWAFGWNQVNFARIMMTHVCYIALTLAGSLGRCLNTRPNGLVFKQLPWDPANVDA